MNIPIYARRRTISVSVVSVFRHALAVFLFEESCDFAFFGVSAGLFLRVELLAVDDYVEDSFGALDQGR